MKLKIFLLLIAAFVVRLININQSLWFDEATTARVVQQYRYLDIIKKFSPYDFHPPLYYLFMKFWTNIFGYSEISLRFPSVIFSLITGWTIFLIGKKLKNEKFGFWAAIFFLFNPLIIYYSQEARMYMMTTMFLTSALYYFCKNRVPRRSLSQISRDGDDNTHPCHSRANGNLNLLKIPAFAGMTNTLLMNLFFSLAFLTFYGSIFFITSILFYLLIKKQWKSFFISLFIIIYSLFMIYPLLSQQLINAKFSLMAVKNWSLVLGKANLKNLLLIPVKFSIGRIDFYPKWIYYLISGTWTFFVFFLLFKNLKLKIKNSRLKVLLCYLLIFPLFLGFIISFITPLLQYFRFLYLIPVLAILLSFVDDLNKKILLFGFLFFSLIYLIFPQFHREDWKSLSFYLKQNQIEEVFIIPSSADPLLYYNKEIKINDLRKICQKKDLSFGKKIYFIPYTAEIYGFSYQDCLANIKFSLKERKNFHRLPLEIWKKN